MGDGNARAFVDARVGDMLRLMPIPEDYWSNGRRLASTLRTVWMPAERDSGESLLPRERHEGRWIRLSGAEDSVGSFSRPPIRRGFRGRPLSVPPADFAAVSSEDEAVARRRLDRWREDFTPLADALRRPTPPPPGMRLAPTRPLPLVVRVLDVGQADCILLQMPNGERWLVDAAPSSAIRRLKAYLPKDVERPIDRAFISHLHADHVTGFPSLVRQKLIRTLYLPAEADKTLHPSLTDLQKLQKAAGLEVVVMPPDTRDIETSFMKVRVCFDRAAQDENGRSVVMTLEADKVRVVLPGDYEARDLPEAVRQTIGGPRQDGILVYKASHHGAENGPHGGVLEMAGQAVSIISCGRHEGFRHPRQKAVAEMAVQGGVCRTDVGGTIAVTLPFGTSELPALDAAACSKTCRKKKHWCTGPHSEDCSHVCGLKDYCCAGYWKSGKCSELP